MCFVLYAGTSMPIPQKEWRNDVPGLSVEALTERESPIAVHFSKPEVRYIGSTSGCGCDFPHVMFQNGDWPWFDDGEHDPEQEASDRYNREALVNLLQATGEQTVELYGVWDGDFMTPPAVREEIALTVIVDPSFRFREQGLYVVRVA
ncbi:hypothetical protein [uncultured Paludibaculum sp.]|uniref:hypothetical protein n=1 Tax=uncultured Paludibaculum sp. TaxID=1765020 RepID=UPI002AAB0068|nr:hypothetical protein [uncultured Paludibaculum sp.]